MTHQDPISSTMHESATSHSETRQAHAMESSPVQAHRGEFLHFLENPSVAGADSYQYFKDGLLVIENGHVSQFGDAETELAQLPAEVPVIRHPNALMVPGFVDTHVHYPQFNIIAAYGTQLLDWLETHVFPEERKFSDRIYAKSVADQFLGELIRNGTTTALVFGTVHPQSVDAFFDSALEKNLRMICGKVLMDRNAPDWLLDTPESAFSDSEELIKRWHGKNRLGYAITPRFAPTSSAEQLTVAAQLRELHTDVLVHTHVAENEDECRWVSELFPEQRSYLDVYNHFGLLGEKSVLAHGIHFDKQDWQLLSSTNSAIAHCPTSNLFIGSGLFNYKQALEHKVRVGLGTDVGGGDSFSLLRTINEAYKIQQLQDNNLSPFQSLYLATLGGARTLSLQSHIGNFSIGNEADFVVMDYNATPLTKSRIGQTTSLEERLFVLQMLGDDRCIRETWIMGKSQKGL